MPIFPCIRTTLAKAACVATAILTLGSSATVRAQSFTKFPIPTVDSGPGLIVAGSDGALWFTARAANSIWRITTDGVITEFPIPTVDSGPGLIAAGSDGALWFTEANAG